MQAKSIVSVTKMSKDWVKMNDFKPISIRMDTKSSPKDATEDRTVRNLALKIGLDARLNATEHRILALFLAIVPPNLRIEIGHKDISERLGISRPQVSRAMRRLEDRLYFTKLANGLYKFPDLLKTEGVSCPWRPPQHAEGGTLPVSDRKNTVKPQRQKGGDVIA